MPNSLISLIMKNLYTLPDAQRFEIWRKARDKYNEVARKGLDDEWSRQLSSIAYSAYMWDKDIGL